MILLLTWLIVSVLCTGLVLVGIRFAPRIDDEPLDRFDDARPRIDEGHLPSDRRSQSGAPKENTGIRRLHVIRGNRIPSNPKLAGFAINRPEETQP